MTDELSTAQRILDAAEDVLRRYGVEKTNVVDIARALDMSHGNIYRHYPSKQALIQAVALRWLDAVARPLDAIASDSARPAAERLLAWFDTLRAIKRRKVLDDPELFRVHHNVVEQVPEVVDEHIASMLRQVTRIISDGVKAGDFSRRVKPAAAARAFLLATASFHHPALLQQARAATDADARAIFSLLLAGLRAGPA